MFMLATRTYPKLIGSQRIFTSVHQVNKKTQVGVGILVEFRVGNPTSQLAVTQTLEIDINCLKFCPS